MNAMAEKLQAAGVDTVGARLTAACTEAIRRHPESAVDAWRHVGALFGHEFVRGLMNDMQRNIPAKELAPAARSPMPPAAQMMPRYEYQKDDSRSFSAAYKPRVVPPERLEKRRELQIIVRSKYKNSGNVPWSDVGWHELSSLKRDGTEAGALLAAAPAHVPNDGRSVGDVLGVKKVDEIIAEVRAR